MKIKRTMLTPKEFDTLKQMITANKAPNIIIKTFKKNGMLTFSYASLKKNTLYYFNMYCDIKNKKWVECTPPHPSYKISQPLQETMFTTSISQRQSENNTKHSSLENTTTEKPPLNSSNIYHHKINLKDKLKPIPLLNELELAIASKESSYSLAIPGNDIMTILKNIHFIEQAINSMNHNLSVLINYYNELD
ncbi:hypothetical protein [Clostridium sp. ZS2-4]|uniref:hypothetical protein n=1 Tax=Clostridium sp. ZS2-4 TaxID=2987703 RepID=UPI00227A7097|nr:hypothetical protein [Clostridium sp. ZS2-4]MCY6356002.1 hypothetical protein [Clostridium sp. ZS2-4]